MISANGITLRYGKRPLFEDVNIKFTPGNCYGLIGANGAGKSTFLKILSGEIDATSGVVSITPGERLAVLKQNHFEFDEFEVLETVIMGHSKLYSVMKEKDELYAKEDFTEEDGIKAGELEGEFEHLNGWQAEADAGELLNNLGITPDYHYKRMSELDGKDKVRVLLAQALFGNPDILLLDEPTNHLDLKTISWLEEFIINYQNTVIVVSHDRHFLNKVCTHIADIDYGKIQLYVGNYDFWYESSQLTARLMKDANKKKEEKIKELQSFIERFSSNASKAKQATARKKQLDKITIDDIKSSSRKFPYVNFQVEREAGNDILEVVNLSKTVNGECLFKNINFRVNKGDKIAFVGGNELSKTILFKILLGEEQPDEGEVILGKTIKTAYFPKENSEYFNVDLSIVDWLRQYSSNQEESYIRGFLGKMLFSGEESLKKVSVLSGGEKVRCMVSKMMMESGNLLILDEPTNHLDLESITALNNGLISFNGNILLVSQDHQFVQTIANRIIEITPEGIIDKLCTYDEYLNIE